MKNLFLIDKKLSFRAVKSIKLPSSLTGGKKTARSFLSYNHIKVNDLQVNMKFHSIILGLYFSNIIRIEQDFFLSF